MSPLPGKLAICSFCFLIIIGIFSRILPTNAAEIEVNGCIYDPETMYDDQIALFLDECLGRQQVDNPSHVNSAPLSSHNAVQPPIAKEVLPSFHSASSKPDIQGKEQKQTRHPESSTTASSVSSSSGSYVWDDDVSDDDNQDISTDNLSRSSHIPSLRSTIAVLLCALVPLSIYFFWFKVCTVSVLLFLVLLSMTMTASFLIFFIDSETCNRNSSRTHRFQSIRRTQTHRMEDASCSTPYLETISFEPS